MELSTILSESLGHQVEVTLIDRSDAFVFGFAKLDVMFGGATPEAVRFFSGPKPTGTTMSPASRCGRTS
ncbi:hypothetical protein [Piscinibacter sp. XHJ-5]|uniref:hypothetical protein n=1 Tax=Piscinibacter sp. XHJ-5 TaxID=3037797 RepID=UPI0024528FD3|nr:hypothetical protein [Piscinibacter sp. XHJ-5]